VEDIEWPSQVMISNGPLLPKAMTLLVESRADQVSLLANRFLRKDVVLAENLALLQRGEGICIQDERIFPVSWHPYVAEERLAGRNLT
jgi:hypothetical protein